MKKLFAFLTIAAMVFAACEKKPVDNPDDNNNNNNNDPEPEEYVVPITIDGNFDDWAKIDASKLIVAKCADEAAKPDLKVLKVYADETYVFCYVEFNFDDYDGAPDDAHFHFYFNGDNDTATGGWNGSWDQGETPCVDLLTEADVITAGEVVEYNPTQLKYAGAPNTSEWGWEDVSVDGFITGKGTKKAYEFMITRELYPLGSMAMPFTMGIDVCVNGWNATGALPNAAVTDDNPSGQTNLLEVKMTK